MVVTRGSSPEQISPSSPSRNHCTAGLPHHTRPRTAPTEWVVALRSLRAPSDRVAWGFISDEVFMESNGRPGYGRQSVGAQESGVRPGEGWRTGHCGTARGTNTNVLSLRLGEHTEDAWAPPVPDKCGTTTGKSHGERR